MSAPARPTEPTEPRTLRRWLRDRDLTLALSLYATLALAVGTWGAWGKFKDDQRQHGQVPRLSEFAPLWAQEMAGGLWDEFAFGACYVVLTRRRRHVGSPESRTDSEETTARLERIEEAVGRLAER